MSINCLIVDDEPLARELLESHISRFSQLKLVASCANAIDAYQYLEKQQIDLMFLDIEMPLLKGNNFLKGLKDPPNVIITTAYREYALEGYELNIIDYLLKPIVFDRFFKAIEKFGSQQVSRKSDDFIFFQTGNRHIRLVLDEILFIESFKDYVTIHLDNSQDISVKYNISAFQNLLDDRFLRVHRSYIIHTGKITSFSKSEAWINSVQIPIGDSYKDSWKTFLDNLLKERST